MIMVAETISLGILSLPSVLATIGMVPGAILIVSMGALATYSGYVIGQFRNAHPWVHSMADAGHVLFSPWGERWGRFGREFLGAAQVIFLIFSMASHILTWEIGFNTITSGATCTIVWGVIALVLFWIIDLPRTLKNVSYFSIASFISIFSAVMITMIDVGITNPGMNKWHDTQVASFADAFLSVTNIVFAYAGHVAFFGFISEFKKPRDFPKALALLQITDTVMYLVAAVVIYRYGGDSVDSPALGSAGTTVKKVAWGIAIPTIIIAGVIYGHVATKYIYVRIFRGTRHMAKRTWLSFGTWAAIALTLWIIAFIIAESIPDFNDLLALISSLFAAWFTYGISGIFWLFINWGQWFKNPKKMALFALNVLMFGIGLGICGMGLYASGKAINEGSKSGSWTCKQTKANSQ
jgi:Transmembrane amino acid transporter protein